MAWKRIIGIYNADGGFWGEVRYLSGRLFGRTHCELCDITHGVTGEKSAWKRCRAGVGVSVETIHRNEMWPALATFVGQRLPCVVGETDRGDLALLIGRESLAECRGEPDRLAARIDAALERHGEPAASPVAADPSPDPSSDPS